MSDTKTKGFAIHAALSHNLDKMTINNLLKLRERTLLAMEEADKWPNVHFVGVKNYENTLKGIDFIIEQKRREQHGN